MLELYIPSPKKKQERDVQSKLAIQKSSKNELKNTCHERVTRFFQCQCGLDNHVGCEGRQSKERQIPWKNVGCLMWIKLVTLHDAKGLIFRYSYLISQIDNPMQITPFWRLTKFRGFLTTRTCANHSLRWKEIPLYPSMPSSVNMR